MSDSSKNDKTELNEVEIETKIKEAREKFDQNYLEFKRKKITEVPCFRSSFLTGINIRKRFIFFVLNLKSFVCFYFS